MIYPYKIKRYQKMKKFFLLSIPIIAIALLASACMGAPAGTGQQAGNTQTAAPSWLMNTDIEYPRNRFIVATGEGRSRADAEAAAVAGISLFFNTRTEVRNEAIREFNEAVTNNTTDFTRRTYITESAVISSDEEFLGLRFTVPFFEQRRQVWSALAYIDRAEAARTYDSKITVNMTAINAMADDAARESEPLYACGLLFRAIRIGDITEEYIKTAAVIDSSSTAKYSAHLALMQTLRSQYRTIRADLTFSVDSGSEDSSGRIARKLQEILEDNGCTVSARNPLYTVSALLNMSEENLPAGVFIRSGITVRIERNGRALLSYSKNYDRSGHQTAEAAYSRVFQVIENDLAENFAQRLTALIGR
jgi:hypothetical protein